MEFLQANLHFLAVKMPMNFIRAIATLNEWSVYVQLAIERERGRKAIQFIRIIGNI